MTHIDRAQPRNRAAIIIARATLVAVLCLSVLSPAPIRAEGAHVWQSIVPGPIFSLASFRSEGGILFAGSTNGVWRSGNGGNTWQWAGPGPSGPVGVLAVHPVDRHLIFAGTGLVRYDGPSGTGLYRSQDSGSTWRRSSDFGGAASVNAILLPVAEPTTVWAGTTNGLFQSLDAGETWTPVVGTIPAVTILTLTEPVTGTLYAGTVSGLYKSTNAGQNWTTVNVPQLPGGAIEVLAADPSRPDTLYLHGRSGSTTRLLKSVNGGVSWGQIGATLGTATAVRALLVDPRQPNTVYLGTVGYGLYTSPDRGVNWAQSTGLTGIGPNRGGDIVNTIVRAGDVVLAGIGDGPGHRAGVFTSLDPASDWASLTPLAAPAIEAIVPDPGAAGRLFAIAGGKIYRSTNAGQTWSLSVTGITGISFSPITRLAVAAQQPHVIYAGSQQYGVFRSVDGGQTWARTSAGMPSFSVRITALATDPGRVGVVWAGTSQDGLYWTGNFATDWLRRPLPNVSLDDWHIRAVAVDPTDSNRVFVGTASGRIFRSLDGGQSWIVPSAELINANQIVFAGESPRRILVAAAEGLWISDDNGATYTLGLAGNITSIATAPNAGGTVYAAVTLPGGESSTIRISTNAGQTWSDLPLDFPNHGQITDVAVEPAPATRLLAATGATALWTYATGRSAGASIGEAGGTVSSADGRVTLSLPAGGINGSARLTITTSLAQGFLTGSDRSIGPAYSISGEVNGQPVVSLPSGSMLTITYQTNEAGFTTPANLQIARYQPVSATWSTLPDAVPQPDTNQISAPVTVAGWFSLWGPRPPHRIYLPIITRDRPNGW